MPELSPRWNSLLVALCVVLSISAIATMATLYGQLSQIAAIIRPNDEGGLRARISETDYLLSKSGAETVVSGRHLTLTDGHEVGITHRCKGAVKRSTAFGDARDASYCIGTNILEFTDAAGKRTDIESSVSTGPKDAPILLDVAIAAPPHPPYDEGARTVLVSYGVIPCTFTEDDCGVGMDWNHVTLAVDGATGSVRHIKNYPAFGYAVWNGAGTKAFFPAVQVGGAGCDMGRIVGYDLLTDAAKDLTKESACPFDGDAAFEITGKFKEPQWGPIIWGSHGDTITAALLGIDGKWRTVEGSY
ncbi:MAG: hypothetical protein RLZZ324_1253 [Candidatus Parcubacteria bacterium]|jgi:hypothetical protein